MADISVSSCYCVLQCLSFYRVCKKRLFWNLSNQGKTSGFFVCLFFEDDGTRQHWQMAFWILYLSTNPYVVTMHLKCPDWREYSNESMGTTKRCFKWMFGHNMEFLRTNRGVFSEFGGNVLSKLLQLKLPVWQIQKKPLKTGTKIHIFWVFLYKWLLDAAW